MHWIDEGVVLSVRPHGEGHAVAHIMTREHGRHLGLVRGGMGRKWRPVLQSGNGVSAVWNARLESHLGTFVLDLTIERAGRWLHHPAPLQALNTLTSHLHLLAEREPHAELYEQFVLLLDALDTPLASAMFVRFESMLLQDLGFGLDLGNCAVTGEAEDLTHVSPRTGRAVGRGAAAPYIEKLLRLPEFLNASQIVSPPGKDDIMDGAQLTGFFLERHVYAPRGLQMPQARAAFFSAFSSEKAETSLLKSG
jgi:DNA repair protein RecO (recombination protein O)